MIETLKYRSCKVCERLKNQPLTIPICIPTYGRPDSAMSKVWKANPELPCIFFVRAEQKELYQNLKSSGAKIVYLKNVTNIGDTRRKICDWAITKGYTDIFMFDDRVKRVSVLAPRLSRTGRYNMGTVPEYKSIVDALRLWEYLIKLYTPDISGCPHSGYTFDINNAGQSPKRFGVDCQIAIHLNVNNLYQNGIKYKDVEICGSEDAQINFDILEAKLKYMVFLDLEYDNIPSSDDLKGGISGVEQNSRKERFTTYCTRFMKNICGENHPGVKIKEDKRGIPYIRFNWAYYRKRNGVIEVEPNYSKYQRL